MDLSLEQKHKARQLAQAGYGREDVCVRIEVATNHPWVASMVRLQSWRRPMAIEDQKKRARKAANSFRTRQISSVVNRNAPITLPTLSILCKND